MLGFFSPDRDYSIHLRVYVSVFVDLLLVVGIRVCSVFCCELLSVLSSFAIILMGIKIWLL